MDLRPVPAILSLWCTVRLRCPSGTWRVGSRAWSWWFSFFVFNRWDFAGKNLGIWCKNRGMIWDFEFENGEHFGISMDFQTHLCGLATHNTCRLDPWGSDGRSPLETWIATEKIAIAFLEGVRSTSFVVSSTSGQCQRLCLKSQPSFFLGVANYLSHIYIYIYTQIPAFWLSDCPPVFGGSIHWALNLRL